MERVPAENTPADRFMPGLKADVVSIEVLDEIAKPPLG